MSDRLSDLLRQRALLQEHLAWLDREIETAAHGSGALRPSPLAPTPALPHTSGATTPAAPKIAAISVSTVAPSAENVVVPGADAILDKYRIEPRSVRQDVRKGCFLYFAAAFVLLGLGVTALYFLVSSR